MQQVSSEVSFVCKTHYGKVEASQGDDTNVIWIIPTQTSSTCCVPDIGFDRNKSEFSNISSSRGNSFALHSTKWVQNESLA